jgi:hypothetical protein
VLQRPLASELLERALAKPSWAGALVQLEAVLRSLPATPTSDVSFDAMLRFRGHLFGALAEAEAAQWALGRAMALELLWHQLETLRVVLANPRFRHRWLKESATGGAVAVLMGRTPPATDGTAAAPDLAHPRQVLLVLDD